MNVYLIIFRSVSLLIMIVLKFQYIKMQNILHVKRHQVWFSDVVGKTNAIVTRKKISICRDMQCRFHLRCLHPHKHGLWSVAGVIVDRRQCAAFRGRGCKRCGSGSCAWGGGGAVLHWWDGTPILTFIVRRHFGRFQ